MALPKQVLRYHRKLSAIDYELFLSDFLATISIEPLTADLINYTYFIYLRRNSISKAKKIY